MSNRQFHLDKRAEDILAKLRRENFSDNQKLPSLQVAQLFGITPEWLSLRRTNQEGPRCSGNAASGYQYKVRDLKRWLQERATHLTMAA